MKRFVVVAICLLCVFSVVVQSETLSSLDDEHEANPLLNKLRKAFSKLGEIWHRTAVSVFGIDPFWDRTYEFKIPEVFRGMTIAQFAQHANGVVVTENDLKDFQAALEIDNTDGNDVALGTNSKLEADIVVPESYNFFEKYPECIKQAWNQGKCGACWAFSIAGSLTHRLCKALKDANLPLPDHLETSRLSPQMLLSCGNNDPKVAPPAGKVCVGGNIPKGMVWLKSNFIFQSSCAKYKSWDGNPHGDLCAAYRSACPNEKSTRASARYTIDNFNIVKGEDLLKKAIFLRGPIAVTMKTPANLIGASGKGVFSRGSNPFLTQGQMHSYHGVVLAGWGTEVVKGVNVPYWIMENSWGELYAGEIPHGNKGMLKILRGKAEDMEIESMLHFEGIVKIADGDKKVDLAQGLKLQPAALSVSSFRSSNGELNIGAIERAAEHELREAANVLHKEQDDIQK